MAGAATTTMVFETLQGDGGDEDFIPLVVDDDPYRRIIQTVYGRVELPRAQELWPRPGGRAGAGVGFSFPYGYLRPEEISSLEEAEEATLSASRHAAGMDMEPRDDDDERFAFAFAPPVPRLPPRAGRDPFEYSRAGLGRGRAPAYRHGTGGVPVDPVAAAVVKKLEMRRYGEPGGDGGTSADSTACVICIQNYEAGDELTVVPCSGRHVFHQKCLAVWLARKPLCPLCRHSLPAVAQ